MPYAQTAENVERRRVSARAAQQRYYARHREQCLALSRKYLPTYFASVRGMIASAKASAKKRGIAFTLIPGDLEMPEVCPILGLRLERGQGKHHAASPTIDRIDSSRGYVRGNVVIISHRANMIKNGCARTTGGFGDVGGLRVLPRAD